MDTENVNGTTVPVEGRPAPDRYPAPGSGGAVTRQVRARYAIQGLIMGCLWIATSGVPPWEHFLRAAIIGTIVLLVTDRTRLRRAGAGARPRLSARRMIVARIGLIAVATVAEMLLSHRTDAAATIVAVALAIVVAFGGPRVHGRFVIPAPSLRGSRDR
jgi:hypothetical protein